MASEVDYNHSNCVDVCDVGLVSLAQWSSIFDSNSLNANKNCFTIVLTAVGDLISHGLLQGAETTDFADSLVFDDRIDTCFAYDPRDALRRRLQNISPADCQQMTCFDCAYTAGACLWDPNFKEC